MKKIMLLILALALIGAVNAAGPDVAVSGFSVKDGAAAVGRNFTLAIMLTNTNEACARSITTGIQASPPVIMNGLSSKPAGDLCMNSTTEVSFPVRIDPSAKSGTYQITVSNTYESVTLAQFTTTSIINLYVGGSPEITAGIASSNPVDVYPGDTATVTFSIANSGSSDAQRAEARLSADAPLEVKWSGSYSSLGTLAAKADTTAAFQVSVPKDAEAKDYPVTLRVSYLDESLSNRTKDFIFMFHVKKKAMFSTSEAGSDGLYANENSKTVRLMVKNTGTDAAKSIKARIQPMYPFTTDGSVRYIDSLAPGQEVPVTFTVNVDKDATPGTYGLDMLLDFEDAQGKSLQDTADVSMTVQSKDIVRAVFIEFWYLWMIAVIVILLVMARRARSAKKK